MSNTTFVHSNRPGPRAKRLQEMLRVDHAGEYGAVQIYKGQRAVFDRLPQKARLSRLLKEMEEGEQKHLKAFDGLLAEHKARPTAFAPVWNIAGFALGAGTALMGEKAAMACTSAVEEVIEKHYAEQAEELGDSEPELRDTILEFREDELEHKDTAIEEGAEEAPGYGLLKGVIQAGCHLAIRLSEKV
ncbi:MAG: demethoxyubiquinone hydroxylase family protein [Aquisalinus sp.]|nr:demethoxyubiquinone hydroxylase family protein [Aquisalinus sp.]